MSSDIYYNPRSRKKASQGQARVQFITRSESQNGTGQQAGSRSRAVRMVRQMGSESGKVQNQEEEKNRDLEKPGAKRKTAG